MLLHWIGDLLVFLCDMVYFKDKVMIQYYKDLIATVTYDKIIAWCDKNQYPTKRFETFFNGEVKHQHILLELSRAFNKPIDHIVHEMKNVQQPDNIERLKAITNEQWRKFAEKYNLEFDLDCNDRFDIDKNGKHRLYAQYLYIREVSVDGLAQRRRVLDKLLFFKNILAETISEFDYAQNIHDLITELEGL
jgi:hypothetical protein